MPRSVQEVIDALRGNPNVIVAVVKVEDEEGHGVAVVSDGISNACAGFLSLGTMLAEWEKERGVALLPDEIGEAARLLQRFEDKVRAKEGKPSIPKTVVDEDGTVMESEAVKEN